MAEDSEVDHPKHYNEHPSGVECIRVVEHFNFNVGNAVKYLWRAGLKRDEDVLTALKKARWYVQREIERLEERDFVAELTERVPMQTEQVAQILNEGRRRKKRLQKAVARERTVAVAEQELYEGAALVAARKLRPSTLPSVSVGSARGARVRRAVRRGPSASG